SWARHRRAYFHPSSFTAFSITGFGVVAVSRTSASTAAPDCGRMMMWRTAPSPSPAAPGGGSARSTPRRAPPPRRAARGPTCGKAVGMAERERQGDHAEHRAVVVIRNQVRQQRHVGELVLLARADLHQDVDRLLLHPGRAARLDARPARAAAAHLLTALDREV